MIVIGCFLGAILYYTNVRRNVYREGSTADMAMGKPGCCKMMPINLTSSFVDIDNELVVTSAMYEEHCSKDVQNFTH